MSGGVKMVAVKAPKRKSGLSGRKKKNSLTRPMAGLTKKPSAAAAFKSLVFGKAEDETDNKMSSSQG